MHLPFVVVVGNLPCPNPVKGVTEKATAQLMDYRLVEGQFQHIFSVEMLEAVGHKGIGQFFQHSAYLLDETGTLQIQVITVPDDRYDVYRNNRDFIQKFIFPQLF